MKTFLLISVPILTCLLSVSSYAATFCVSDATGLQTALTTAASNSQDDTIQIVQGNYVGSFIYASTEAYDITVEGGYTDSCASRVIDPANTVLDAKGAGSVLVLSTPEVVTVFVVAGATFQNGIGNGMIYANTLGNVIITNNTIKGNSSFTGNMSDGIYVPSAKSITITNNSITGNGISGVNVISNSVALTNNTIMGNYFCGVYVYVDIESDDACSLDFTNNTINGNGSGVSIQTHYESCSVSFANNTVNENINSGGIYASAVYSSTSFIDNTITGNITIDGSGGGIACGGQCTFINNTITGNSVIGEMGKLSGGGVACGGGQCTFTNNTITGNSAAHFGGGIYVMLFENGDETDIANNIIWNNSTTGSGNDIYIENDANNDYLPSPVNLYNNDFDHSAEGIFIQIPFSIDSSNLNNLDPLFVNAPNSDYHLTGSSPCIDAGRMEGAATDDMDGEPRPMGNGVEIGADEYTSFIPTTTSTTTTISPLTSTTTTASSPPCAASLIYGTHSEEAELLRYFRDNVLSNTVEGRALIRMYYLLSPIIVKAMEGDEDFKEETKQMIDDMLLMIEKDILVQ